MDNVTVIIPVLNGSKTLAQCLAAPGLLGGTFRPKIIVVDNGSEDSSREIASSFGVEMQSCGRPGPAAARNIGIYAASTPYVAFTDADCIPQAGWLENLLTVLCSSNNYAGVGGAIEWQSFHRGTNELYTKYCASNQDSSSSGEGSFLLTGNAIFRREVLIQAGGFQPKLNWCEDLELGLRLCRQGAKFGYAANAVVCIEAPATAFDQFVQFYKYGAGLEHVRYLAKEKPVWSPWKAWYAIAVQARAILFKKGARLESRVLLAQLAYFFGWTDARLRRFVSELRPPKKKRLPAIGGSEQRKLPSKGLIVTVDIMCENADLPALLEFFKDNGIIASFFVTGKFAETHLHAMKMICRYGHSIFSLGYSARRFDSLSKCEILDELEQTEQALSKVRKPPIPYALRLPYGLGHDDGHVHEAIAEWNPFSNLVGWDISIDQCIMNFSEDPDVARSLMPFHRDELSSIRILHWNYRSFEYPDSPTIHTKKCVRQVVDLLAKEGFRPLSLLDVL